MRDGADIAVLKEVFVGGEYRIPSSIEPKKLVDIGSHIGASVAFFACTYPHAIVTAYEPDPENFDLLVKNMQQFQNITCVQAAVSSISGEVSFFRNAESSISSSLMRRSRNEEKISVRSVSIHDVLRDGKTDLMKFDIEGGEYSMFASADASMLPAICIGEVHYDLMAKSKEDFLRLFPGYTCEDHPLSDHRAILFLCKDTMRSP